MKTSCVILFPCIFLSSFAFFTASAQSPFRTAKSDGSIILDKGGLAQISLTETLLRIGYQVNQQDLIMSSTHEKYPDQKVRFIPRFGAEIQGKPSDNVSTVFSSDKLTTGAQATVSLGLGYLFGYIPSSNQLAAGDYGPRIINRDWLTLQATYNRSTSTLYNSNASFAEQFNKEDFEGYAFQLSYNAEVKGRVPLIVGVATGLRRTNNVDELSKIQVEDKQTISAADGTVRTITTIRTGFRGTYEEKTRATLNTDFVFYPFLQPMAQAPAVAPRKSPLLRASVAFNVFTRSALGDEGYFIPGVGAFVTAPGAPLKVYGGVSVYRDQKKQAAVDIVTGFAF